MTIYLFILYTDASLVGFTGVLIRFYNLDPLSLSPSVPSSQHEVHIVTTYSRSLLPYEKNYNANKKETAAVVHAITYFKDLYNIVVSPFSLTTLPL